jgi:hypothetical protein
MRGIEILLDRPRHLIFDINAIAEFEERASKGIGQMLQNQSIAAIRLALWVGLKTEDRTMTPERAGDVLQRYLDQYEGAGEPLQYVVERINQALVRSGIIKKATPEGNESEPTTTTESASSAPASVQ